MAASNNNNSSNSTNNKSNGNNNGNSKSIPSKTVALTASGKPKEKRRNNEKRKEKSRDAARTRRSRETEIFAELADVLPLKKEDVNQLDKASIMRVAIAFLKIREMLNLFPNIKALTAAAIDNENENENKQPQENESKVLDMKNSKDEKLDFLKMPESSQLLKQTLNGFLLILSDEGDITYVSENVCEYLGISKIDILGQPVWEYLHQCDHAELKEALNLKRNGLMEKVKDENMLENGLTTYHRDLFIRFKCTLTSRGRSINIKSASYKVIHVSGHLVVNANGDQVFVSIGSPIPHPANIEIPLGTTTFLTKHSLDMKFTYVDEKMYSLLNYKPEDLLQTSLFDCHHGGDSESLLATFKSVHSKGQGETSRYRFLGKYGGYCWLVTQATIVCDKSKPQSVVCVNYVISQLENDNEICSLSQYEESNKKILESKTKQETTNSIALNIQNNNNNNNNSNNSNDNNNNNNRANSLDELKQITSSVFNQQIDKEKQQQQHQQKQPQETEEEIKTIISNISLKNINNNHNNNNSNNSNNPSCNNSLKAIINQNHINSPVNNISLVDNNKENQNIEKDSIDIKSEPLPTLKNLTSTSATTSTKIVYKPIPADKLSFIQQQQQQQIQQQQQHQNHSQNRYSNIEKLPKSVTASVFKVAPTPTQSNSNTNTTTSTANAAITTTNNICHINTNTSINPLLLPSINSTKTNTAAILSSNNRAAQSVTASVLRPITTTTTTAAIFAQQQNNNRQNLNNLNNQNQNLPEEQQKAKPQAMHKGFLSFAEDVSQSTMLKEEPDDLSHITSASLPLFSDVLGLMGSYSSLLPEDINSLDSTSYSSATDVSLSATTCNNSNSINKSSNHFNKSLSNTNGPSLGSSNCNMDPFITYREESNDTNCSQHLLSPSVASQSPEGSSLPSLCSPHSLCQEEDYALITMHVDEDIDLAMRAPYIPMDERDDLPLLTNDNKDIMWPDGSGSFSVDELSLHKDSDTLHELSLHHLQQQSHHSSFYSNQTDQHFSNSLCSSPASSTISSLSPASPLQIHQQQQPQQQHHQLSSNVFCTDSSELAALLGGTGNGTLSILNNNCNLNGSGNNDSGGIVNNIVDNSQHEQQQQHQESNIFSRIQNLEDLKDLHEHQQNSQPQDHLINLNLGCKKEKFDNNSLASSLCDSIDGAFDNIYTKDSSNVDCWSEFLQLNVTDQNTNSSTSLEDCKQQMQQIQQLLATTSQQNDCQTQQQQQQQQQQHNIIINAVPLITIQNNKNILLQTHADQQQDQQQHQQELQNSTKMLLNDDLMIPTNDFLTSVKTQNNNTNLINNNLNKISTIKLINGSTASISPLTTKATIRFIENKAPLQGSPQAQQMGLLSNKTGNVSPNGNLQQHTTHQQHASKRHLSSLNSSTTQVESKRLKGNETATPQLLQQLVSGHSLSKDLSEELQQQQKSQKNPKGSTLGSLQNQQHQQQHPQQQQQQSNSVLKNLLISGCDVSAGYCIMPMRPKKFLAKA